MVFDPRSNLPDFLLIRAHEAAKDVINGVYGAEKKYVYNMQTDSVWVSNPYLRNSPTEFSLFLKKLSLKTRRLFLFLSAQLTFREFANSIGFSSTTRLQKYLDMVQQTIPQKFLARLAVFHRVPIQWLENEQADDFLDIDQFYASGYPIIDGISGLLKIIEDDAKIDFWVRGVVMRNGRSSRLFLRIENQKGNFLIEFANELGDLADFQEILFALKNSYECVDGYLDTIFPTKRNAAIFCKRNDNPFDFPIELHLLNK